MCFTLSQENNTYLLWKFSNPPKTSITIYILKIDEYENLLKYSIWIINKIPNNLSAFLLILKQKYKLKQTLWRNQAFIKHNANILRSLITIIFANHGSALLNVCPLRGSGTQKTQEKSNFLKIILENSLKLPESNKTNRILFKFFDQQLKHF